jgi:hypothetical protein
VPKLALDERQRDPLVQELDSVGMAELVFAPTSAQASLSRPFVTPISTGKRAHTGRSPHLDRHNASTCDRHSRPVPRERPAAPGDLRRGGLPQLEQRAIAATKVELHADMTQKQPTIDCGSVLALRSAFPALAAALRGAFDRGMATS